MTQSASPEDAGVVRIATFRARPGQVDGLVGAARRNARDALAADGCRSAEVCIAEQDPDALLVVSRWASPSALRAFLDWHESQAHGAVSPYAAEPPHAVHYRVVAQNRR